MLFRSATERSSSPPLAVATPTGHPTPHRRSGKLRLVSLFILTQTKGAGSPWMLLAPPFPSSATEDRRRQIRRRSAFPELAVHLYGIHVSSSVVSPSPLSRARPLAVVSTMAEPSPPPALVAGDAPVTIWSRACAQRAPRIA